MIIANYSYFYIYIISFISTVCAICSFGADADIKFNIPVGKLFTYELMRETFQNDFQPLSVLSKNLPSTFLPWLSIMRQLHTVMLPENREPWESEPWVSPLWSLPEPHSAGILYNDPMVFKCNLQYSPDLPEWLRLTQRHPYDNGFLYGSPTSAGKSIIEVSTHSLTCQLIQNMPEVGCCVFYVHWFFSVPSFVAMAVCVYVNHKKNIMQTCLLYCGKKPHSFSRRSDDIYRGLLNCNSPFCLQLYFYKRFTDLCH